MFHGILGFYVNAPLLVMSGGALWVWCLLHLCLKLSVTIISLAP